MKIISVPKKDLVKGIEALKEIYRIFAPLPEKDFHMFKILGRGQQPDMNCSNTRLSPKSIVYPQSQIMFDYTLDERKRDHHILKEHPNDEYPQVIFGIRPCDARAFRLVRLNFDTPGYKDPYWISAYEKTTFVGLACNSPCATCFCTTAGCGPFNEDDLDVLLVDAGKYFLAKVITDRGDRLIAAAAWDKEMDGGAMEREIESMKLAAEAKIGSQVRTDRLNQHETTALYDAPFWEDVAFSCINCGTCTYVCPTCWCFDIQDETHGYSGKRLRNWDSCMYPLFTLHGSGHNPRGSKTHRVRQRFMHKLKYYVDKYDAGIQCTGCGRCIRLCPVNIDIRKICNMMNDFDPSACTVET
ncbi:MAG: 4Fe-4S dicluster domain-containing protein [Deltaproteobacteria bacterium]|nr:4Fe-4S dicluster domain-containing protein [Deltaproteobacteria bacterium]MBW1962191.1 4Fe-4S dicluster domain-containing protein [Deltaproteobacteria bacterium]MBW1994065.1 4Fe-4S dicluster domain-containing protein [Deltaproteobacteria bacterium]MBW2152860.1 4Fe-4S dicluster domain-containing protein [Deltaproteobacteria bacterium]